MPKRDNRCNWRQGHRQGDHDNQQNRCPAGKVDGMNCCVDHRCQGDRKCRQRARDGRSLCKEHQQQANRRLVRASVPRHARIEYREAPPAAQELALIAAPTTFEEQARRWNRAARAKVREAKRRLAPGTLKKPRTAAYRCAWHDDSGTRCRRHARPGANCCAPHRCSGHPSELPCTRRALNAGTVCRRHRRLLGRQNDGEKIAPWEADESGLWE